MRVCGMDGGTGQGCRYRMDGGTNSNAGAGQECEYGTGIWVQDRAGAMDRYEGTGQMGVQDGDGGTGRGWGYRTGMRQQLPHPHELRPRAVPVRPGAAVPPAPVLL